MGKDPNASELTKANARAQDFLDVATVMFVVINADQNVELINKKGCEILGYPEAEIVGKNWFDNFVPEDDRAKIKDVFFEIMAGDLEPAEYFENVVVTRDKKERLIAWHNAILRDRSGKPAGTLSSGEDVTERRKIEDHRLELESQLRQAHKMEAIGTLAGGIAHDFNNILSIVLGNVELATFDIPEWHPARNNIEDIRKAGHRAKDVIQQLLSLARTTGLKKKPVKIAPIVKESLKLLRSSIPASIEIRDNLAADVDTIFADPSQINQVLINLCTNADHAMPDGGVLEVGLDNVEFEEDIRALNPNLRPGRYVKLTVSDTGYGIDRGELDRIFDPYFTANASHRSAGMGLAVVHGIVREHDGVIVPKSELNKGTTFEIYFPVTAMKVVTEDEDDAGGERSIADENILLVDDEPSIARVVREMLIRLGYEVDAVTSPDKALKLFRANPDRYDVIISDMTMPQMTGDALVKEFLGVRPDIPVILCTGYSVRIDEERAKEIGAAGYIEKPVDKNELAKMIRSVLGGR